jgi:hypothetical protein
MTIAAMSWPDAIVYISLTLGIALVLSVLIWSIFRTGQTAINEEIRQRRE